MTAYCISLSISQGDSLLCNDICKSSKLITPLDYNCIYHTTILQFYSKLCFEELKAKISNVLIQYLAKVVQSLREWDESKLLLKSAQISTYSFLYSSIGIYYKNNSIVNFWARYILARLEDNDLICNSLCLKNTIEADSSRFQFICDCQDNHARAENFTIPF